VREETGLGHVELGPRLWDRTVVVNHRGTPTRLEKAWFLARVAPLGVDTSGNIDEQERAGTTQHRWWRLGELEATEEVLAPREQPSFLRQVLREGPPPQPLAVGA